MVVGGGGGGGGGAAIILVFVLPFDVGFFIFTVVLSSLTVAPFNRFNRFNAINFGQRRIRPNGGADVRCTDT